MKNKKIDIRDNVEEAKRKLGREAAEIIVKDLNLEGWDGKKACCPFHNDRSPSFMWCDKDRNGGSNYFKCFVEGRVYGITDHYMSFYQMTYHDAAKKLCESQGVEYGFAKGRPDDYFKGYRYPLEEANTKRDSVEKYLSKRHISKQTLDYAGIKQDKDGNIVFEYRDVNNLLLNTKYRPSRVIRNGQPKMWFQSLICDSCRKQHSREFSEKNNYKCVCGSKIIAVDNCPTLFNKQKIDTSKPLLIVEGEICALSAIEAGFTNVVSIPNGANSHQWIEFNYEFLEQFEKIILWYDDDEPGAKALKEVSPRLGIHRTYYVSAPEDIIQKLQNAKGNKKISNSKCDINNVLIACGKQDVIWMIENAKENENEDLTYLFDYDEIDIQSIEKYPSGIEDYDKLLFGTMMNTLTIVTGSPGSGKSVLANLLTVQSSANAGYKSMSFSGELSPELLSGWMLRPFAGRNHIIEWKSEGKPSGYSVTTQSREAIRNAYRKQVILYKKKKKGMMVSPQDIYDAIEYSYKKYGCKVFGIDNLMCIRFGFGDKKYDEQREFILNLIEIAERLPIAIILCVHSTKGDEEVSGVAEILRMAHRCLHVKRLDDDPMGYNSQITIWKERLVGGSAGKKIKSYYDVPTMRLYSNDKDLNMEYSWQEGCQIDYPQEIASKLVINQKHYTEEVFGGDDD